MPLTHGPFSFDTENDSDCQRFDFTSDGNGQTSGVLISAAGVAADFCHDTNGGNSTNIGPQFGQGGDPDGYLYTECSSPGANADEYTMTFDTVLNASLYQWQFNFYTCQKGDDCDTACVVQINENSGGWVTVSGGSFGGSGDPAKLNTADTTAWTSRSVDLSESGANTDSSTQVRLLITSAGATTWHADYGIDTVELVGTEALDREQEGHQFRLDDGSESGATDEGAQDSNMEAISGVNRRLRMLTNMTGDAPAEAMRLDYKEVADGAGEWRGVKE